MDARFFIHANVKTLLDDGGVRLAPDVAVRDELAAGRLARSPDGYEAPALPMHRLFPAGRATPKLRAFIDQAATGSTPHGA